MVYLPVDRDVQMARIAHRQETAPHLTFPMSEADVDAWRPQFQVPDAAELDGGEIPAPSAGWPGWPEGRQTTGPRAPTADASVPTALARRRPCREIRASGVAFAVVPGYPGC